MDPDPSFTSEIQSTTFFYFLHFLQVTFIIHTIQLILYDQQAGEIDNLTVKLGQRFLVVLCRCWLKSYWFDNLGFFLRENLLLYSSYLPVGVSQRTCDPCTSMVYLPLLISFSAEIESCLYVDHTPVGRPQEEGMMSITTSFPSERNQGYRTSRTWTNTCTHNTTKKLCPNVTVRLSMSPAC